jgi:hypothetical protein
MMTETYGEAAVGGPYYYGDGWDPEDITTRKTMNYGSMPTSMLLDKMEVSPATLRETPTDAADAYDAYARSLLVDRGPDAPLLGDEDTSQAGGNGQHHINYRYNGVHGSTAEAVQHPELFLDFSDSNVPGDRIQFEDARRHAAHRIRVLEATFGQNDDHHTAESPYTEVAQRRDRKAMFEWVGQTRKIFDTQRLGRDGGLGGTTAADLDNGGGRAMVAPGADDGVGVLGSDGLDAAAQRERFYTRRGGYGAADVAASAAAAYGGTPDAFFGGGSGHGDRRGRMTTAHDHRAKREGLASGSFGVRIEGLAGTRAAHIANKHGRALAAGRRGAVYGTRFNESADSDVRARAKGTGKPGDLSRVHRWAKTEIVSSAGASAGDARATDLGRGLRAQSAPAARRMLAAGVAETYAAAGADAATMLRSTAAPGIMNPGASRDGRHGTAVAWMGNDAGRAPASSAKAEALPAGGYAPGKQTGTRTETDLRRGDPGGPAAAHAAGGRGGGSAYGRAGGNPVGRGTAADDIVPTALDEIAA